MVRLHHQRPNNRLIGKDDCHVHAKSTIRYMSIHLTAKESQVNIPVSEPDSITVAGDWHGNITTATKVLYDAVNNGSRVVVQLGDFGLWPGRMGKKYITELDKVATALGATILWLDGNHEDFGRIGNKGLLDTRLQSYGKSIFRLPRGSRWSWQGIDFCAVGGATSLDKPSRIEGVTWWPEEELTGPQVADIAEAGVCDVLFTHDVSYEVNVPGIGHRVYTAKWDAKELERAWLHRERLGELTAKLTPTHLYHGHFHTPYTKISETTFGETRVTGLGEDTSGPANWVNIELNILRADVDTIRSNRVNKVL